MATKKEEKFKLKGEHKEYVINKLALHCGVTEIAESLKIDFDVDITPPGIAYYKREWEEEWRKRRDFLNQHIAEVEPFADKVKRVQERGALIRDIVENDDLWQKDVAVKCKQIVRDNKNNPILLKTRSNHVVVNIILDSIQKELEPDKLALTDPSGNVSIIDLIKQANDNNK